MWELPAKCRVEKCICVSFAAVAVGVVRLGLDEAWCCRSVTVLSDARAHPDPGWPITDDNICIRVVFARHRPDLSSIEVVIK